MCDATFQIGKTFSCDEDGCEVKCKTEFALTCHKSKAHNPNVSITKKIKICELCGLEMEAKDLKKHFYLRHHGIGLYKCERCSMDFSYEKQLEAHVELHVNSEYPFLCVLCQQLFTNSMDLKHHVSSNHLASGLKCTVCGIMKPNEFLLQRHLKIHDRVRRFVCSDCGKTFATKGYLKYHEDHYHKHVGRKFPCAKCGKEFLHEKNVLRHLITHREEKPFKCKLCSKTFNYSHLLKKHEETHSNLKNYECHLCGKRFRQEQNLKQHMRSHRPKPEKLGRKRSLKVELGDDEIVEEISYEIRGDEIAELGVMGGNVVQSGKDRIPVILQMKEDSGGEGLLVKRDGSTTGGGGLAFTTLAPHQHVLTTNPHQQQGNNIIEATIIPAELGDVSSEQAIGQYETVQEIQLHPQSIVGQASQTATVVFLYEYNA